MKKEHRRIALGTALSLACYLGAAALLALLLTKGTVREGAAQPWILAFAAVSAFAGSKLASHGGAERWMPAASAAAFWGVVTLLGFLTSDALSWQRAGELALAVSLGAVVACVRREKGRRSRARRSHR